MIRTLFVGLFFTFSLNSALLTHQYDDVYTLDTSCLKQSTCTITTPALDYHVHIHALDTTTYEGTITGDMHSFIRFKHYSDNHIQGVLHVEGKNYSLSSIDDTLVRLVPYHNDLLHDYVVPPQKTQALKALQQRPLSLKEYGIIDVLVLYTAATLSKNTYDNNTTKLHDAIDEAFTLTNQALGRSCATFQYRVVDKVQTTYTKTTDISKDLETTKNGLTLSNETNGTTNSNTLRDTLGADLVQLWVDDGYNVSGGEYVGLAYFLSADFIDANYGYSLVADQDYITVAHELGHNLGLDHDRHTESVDSLEYSTFTGYGYVEDIHKVRTIMSYSNRCREVWKSYCEVVPYFSNPNVYREGKALGQVARVNGIQTMNTNALKVANFKPSVSTQTITSYAHLCQDFSVTQEGLSNCFIATAAYDSYMHEDVQTLRNMRDNIVRHLPFMQIAVTWYYEVSPPIAHYIHTHTWARYSVQVLLGALIFIIDNFWLLFGGLVVVLLFKRGRA